MLSEMERKIEREYKQAEKEVEAKLNDYLRRFEIKDAKKREAVRAGTLTQAEYEKWRVGQVMIGERWKEMKDTLSQDLMNADAIAKKVVNGYMPDVYALNHNYGTFEVEKQSLIDTSYTLYDRHTVERLLRDDPQMLPPPGRRTSQAIAEGRAKRWNNQHIQSVMMQSLLQGESIPKIARRLATRVGDSDMKAAIRNARTMTTRAENYGRLDSYKRAEKMGIRMQKQWISTLDHRTRDSHVDLDGEVQDIDHAFSNGLDCPGGMGPPEEVYNCRCTMVAQLKGFETDASDMNLRHDDRLGDMTYDEWKEVHRQNHSSTEDTTNTNQPLVPVIENPRIFKTSKEADEYFRGETYQTQIGGINRTRGYGVREDSKRPATKWANSLTYKQTTAINDYTGAGYAPINSYLRGQWTKQEAKEAFIGQNSLESTIKAIDAGLNKSVTSEPIRVFRTCESDFLDKISVGGIFHDEGYGSTSVLPFPVASGNVFFEIDIPAGKGIGAYVDGLSWKEGEEFEYLINRGANYYINSIEERKGGTYVKATLAGFER